MTGIRTLPIGLALGCALLMGGCADEPGDATSTPAPTTEAPSTSEPAPTTDANTDDTETTTAPPVLSAEEQDQADIEETLHRYIRAVDDAFNGDASVEGIYPFSRDTAREQWVTQVMASQAQGITSSGFTELEVLEITVEEDTAEVVACADVTDVEVLDENGDSNITDDRMDRSLQDFVVERDDSAEVGWYVVEDTNRNQPCGE